MTIKPRKTNIEFLTDLMNFSDNGRLFQVFVLEGLRIYSAMTLENKEPWGEHMISQEAWNRCAQEYIDKLEARSK